MLHFRMNMPYFYMALYGSVMIAAVFVLRTLLRNKLPKFVFPILWGVVLLRLLVPFSFSSPLSLPVPAGSFLSGLFSEEVAYLEEEVVGDRLNEGTWEKGQEEYTMGTNAPISQVAITEEAVTTVVGEGTGSGAYGIWDGPVLSYSLWRRLPVLYFLGLAAVAGILGRQKYGYNRKLKNGLLIEHNETVNSLLREMNMGHVLVFTSDDIASPMVCGLLNPRIYLPAGMDFCNTVLLRHVLAHETMHIRRRDNWMKAVMLAAIALHWYNPLVWIMSKCLSSDLEAACDAAVLGQFGEEERKGYAYSLLAMAITGSRTTLLYSAFSKTEVEKRVKGILHYKKATIFVMLFAVLFTFGSAAVFATGGQAPFPSYLSAYCASSNCRWGVKATLSRDIALGENPQMRADNAILSVLREDTTADPDILKREIKAALAAEFGVERRAFTLDISLCLDQKTLEKEYAAWGITPQEDGTWLYQGESVRTYEDKMLGSYQSREKGAADISVQRNRLGEITEVTVWRQGDPQYDRRGERIEQGRFSNLPAAEY